MFSGKSVDSATERATSEADCTSNWSTTALSDTSMATTPRAVCSGQPEVDAIDAAARTEIDAALAAADAAPWPQAADALEDVVTTGAGQWQ